MSENQDNTITNKTYKEIEIIYGSEIKSNSIEFRYSEPKKLQEIEKFFIEFYISVRNNLDVYYNSHHELTYFDYSIIYSINDILTAHKNMINHPNIVDYIVSKINKKLYQNFINIQSNGANKINIIDKQRDREVDLKIKDKDSNRGTANVNFLYISKDIILNEMFKDNENDLQNYEEVDGGFYKKDSDGWAVRDIEVQDKFISKKNVATFDLNGTLILSRNEGFYTSRHFNDCSMTLSNRFSIIQPDSDRSDSHYFRKDGSIQNLMDNSSIKELTKKEVKRMKTTVQLKMHDQDYNKSTFRRQNINTEKVIIKSKTAFNYSYDDNMMGSVGSDESYPNIYNNEKLHIASSNISNNEYESDL
jgi:hypothetical protein